MTQTQTQAVWQHNKFYWVIQAEVQKANSKSSDRQGGQTRKQSN